MSNKNQKDGAEIVKKIIKETTGVPPHILAMVDIIDRLKSGESVPDEDLERLAVAGCLQRMAIEENIELVLNVHDYYHVMKKSFK